MSSNEITCIVLDEVDDRRRLATVRWHTGAIPHAHRDANGLIYERTGQTTGDGLLIYRTTEWSAPPPTLWAQIEYGPAASRHPDIRVPDPPPEAYDVDGTTYRFFGWADARRPIYRGPVDA